MQKAGCGTLAVSEKDNSRTRPRTWTRATARRGRRCAYTFSGRRLRATRLTQPSAISPEDRARILGRGGSIPPNRRLGEEIVAVMREAIDDRPGDRLRHSPSSFGGAGCASQRRSRSVNAISTPGAAHCSCASGTPDDAARSAWTPGAASDSGRCSPRASSCRSDRCSASSTARRAGGRGRAPTCASSFAGSPPKQRFGAASRRTSCATPMPSSWHARARRST